MYQVTGKFRDGVGDFGPFQTRETAEDIVAHLASRADCTEAVINTIATTEARMPLPTMTPLRVQ